MRGTCTSCSSSPTSPCRRGQPACSSGVRSPLEGSLGALYDGLRLGVPAVLPRGGQRLANPKRALRALPGALYELGVAVVVALSVAPQLVESVQRVRRARKLRGGAGGGFHVLRSIAIPVMEDALERSLQLAAAMDSAGTAGPAGASPRTRRVTGALMLGGMGGLCLGAYGLLDGSAPGVLGLPALLGGSVLCVPGLGPRQPTGGLQPTTGPTPGGCPSGSSSPAGWFRPWC